MPSAAKENFVTKLTEDLKASGHVVLTEYQGMKAEEFDAVRAALRPLGAKYQVVKNRLAKIALEKNGWGELNGYLKGPSAIVFSGSDSTAITRTLFKINETNKTLKIKAGRVFGMVADAGTLKTIATLPSRETLLSMLLGRLNSPLQSLATILNEPLRSLHAALSAVAKKKESAPA